MCRLGYGFAIAVWLASMLCSCRNDTNSVTLDEVISAIREGLLLLILRDELTPVRVRATSCPKHLTPCEVEWKWINKRKAEDFSSLMRLQLQSNVSTLIDYFIVFWLNHAGGLRLLRYDLNTTEVNQSEPLTLLKMLTDLTLIDQIGRVFDNATVLAAQYAVSHRFDELARCCVSVDHRPRFWEPDWTELKMEQRLSAVVLPFWLETAVSLLKRQPNLSDEFERQVLETEVQIEEDAPPVRKPGRTSDWEVPIVMESVYARRYLQLTAEIEIKDYLLSDDIDVKLGRPNPVGRFRFRHISNRAFLDALEELIDE